ncbi:MAG TPA: transcriptional regulator PpsR [Acidocella sp.]|jgi:transcriptional regulator PpsR|nr:MAG: transcriptional regulator PpsR [Acidocella sp. 20-58-15]OYY04022.1 MAG: transcriptional regulator PpsR [Acidocella sp. 35-58-6]HQT38964.1 transcriptional regulator PpsR [Acidocella sp.]
MKAFKSPARWLAGIDADAAALLIAAAADIAVILDSDGTVRDFAFQSEALALEFADHDHWLGKAWRDQVTVESQIKIDEMLRDAHSKAHKNGRQVNYPAVRGADIPILFSVLPVGHSGQIIAFGRDLRAFATLQQRVVDVQQSFERDYARMRHIETRYRILFQMTPEPVLIVDQATQKIIEANPAARQILGRAGKIIGLHLTDLLKPDAAPVIDQMLANVRVSGRADDVPFALLDSDIEMVASAFLFRQGSTQLLLVKLLHVTPGEDSSRLLTDSKVKLLKLVERVPDGFVVTDHDGTILAANEAFIEMSQLRSESQAQGQSLDKWLGRPGVDLGVLLNNLRQHGSVRLFSTSLRDEFGAEMDVEISAGSVLNGGDPSYGFAIRGISRRVSPQVMAPRAFPKSLEQIIELIGRVSLKDLVREATDVIERLSIEAALTMTRDNRASAAEVLGVSRQSLYVKMRRHGLLEADAVGLE